jgi:hypothetical protein
MSLLTKKQKTTLAIIARDAWLKHHNSGATEEPFDAWRKREAIAACGHSISEAPKRCFNDLYAHFLTMKGEAAQAFERHTGPSNEERQLRYLITQAAQRLGIANAKTYAAGKSPQQLKGILINLTRQVKALQSQDA